MLKTLYKLNDENRDPVTHDDIETRSKYYHSTQLSQIPKT